MVTQSITLEELEQQLRTCLAHLYDYPFLRDHPLVSLLAPDQTGAHQVQSFRQIIQESIERLRPDVGTTFHSKQARTYNILMLRYMDQQQPQEVMSQLALSERQFYRDHPRAIQALSEILYERLTGIVIPVSDQPAEVSLESEVQRVQNQAELAQIDLQPYLAGVLSAAHSLAVQHGVSLSLALHDPLPVAGLHSGILRQTLLLLLSQVIVRGSEGRQLSVSAEIRGRQCQITLDLVGGADQGGATALAEALLANKSLQALINTLDATLQCDQLADPGNLRLLLTLPLNQQTLLLVDDNPDMIALLQRYLAGKPYHVVSAPDGEQAIQIARQSRPDVIILDVMLPVTDGWEVLQNLKNHPATRDVPVLICSVLDAFDLAMSLGVDGYLKKPPSQADFLAALEHCQA